MRRLYPAALTLATGRAVGAGGPATVLCGSDRRVNRIKLRDMDPANPRHKHIPIYLSRFGLRVWET